MSTEMRIGSSPERKGTETHQVGPWQEILKLKVPVGPVLRFGLKQPLWAYRVDRMSEYEYSLTLSHGLTDAFHVGEGGVARLAIND